MPLSDSQREDLRRVAEERGVDADELIREAEQLAAERDGSGRPEAGGGDEGAVGQGQRPAFDRFLIGALPYVRVREFRSIWLGLEESIQDDDLPTGVWLERHGGVHAGGAGDGGEE